MYVADVLLLICLILSFILYAWTSQKLRLTMHGSKKHPSWYPPLLYAVAAMLPIVAMCFFHIPLPAFYILLYGASCVPQLKAKRHRHQEWLFINIRFLIFTAPHLIILGLLGLCIQDDVRSVLGDPVLRALSLLIVAALNAMFNLILVHYLNSSRLNLTPWKSGEIRLFSRFVWLCVCSVIFDSIPCLFTLPTQFSILFLIGSNFLLLLMAFLFARHVYSIIRESHLKDEYLRLQEETAAQHIRTAQLERKAYLDALTGLYTRQYALANMTNMLKNKESFILVFLDLDGLKQVNDRHGHQAGDQYLQKFSSLMKASLKPNDVFSRYGGDEFLIILPDRTAEAADIQLKNIQSDASMDPPEGWGCPFSYGLIEILADAGFSAEEWIARADRAMYSDKKCRHSHREGEQS